jgi:hypothetical protein
LCIVAIETLQHGPASGSSSLLKSNLSCYYDSITNFLYFMLILILPSPNPSHQREGYYWGGGQHQGGGKYGEASGPPLLDNGSVVRIIEG